MTDRTTLVLEGEQTIVITRELRAPAHIVFRAWTEPELLRRWWAPASLGAELVECDADVRVGGSYRYVTRADGQDATFFGEYLEVTPPSRLVYTQIFAPMAELGAAHITVTFEQRGAHTLLTSRERYPSAEVRDVVLASGMEHGMRETMELLDALVAALAAAAR
jgi:uncharacterized protein YndB with AHSA1/START domain